MPNINLIQEQRQHSKKNDLRARAGFFAFVGTAVVIGGLSDEQLDRAVTVSLYANAPLTCQFVLEDHAVRHSYHHLARLKRAVQG